MGFTFARAIIGGQWRFVHRCDALIALFDPGDPVDRETVCIIYGQGEHWWIRDKDDTGYFHVVFCPGCGKELAEQFSALERLGTLEPEALRRLPEIRGLE